MMGFFVPLLCGLASFYLVLFFTSEDRHPFAVFSVCGCGFFLGVMFGLLVMGVQGP